MMTKAIQPFLRWAGGKNWFVPYMKTIISDLEFNNYYEPFLGGGSVFFSLDLESHQKAFLSDLNDELISTYNAVKEEPEAVIKRLKTLRNTEEEYYKIRKMKCRAVSSKAARFIYLNQTSFNGLYRVNKKGEYNVPYGFRSTLSYDYNRILEASRKLQNATVTSSDFSTYTESIKENDLVFLDPPYTVSRDQNGFIKYNSKLFSLDDQYRLNAFVQSIADKGAYYILTNAAHDTIREIFSNCVTVFPLRRSSVIGGKQAKRQKVAELVFTNISVNEFDFLD